jgi:4-amino-4-deoxy-L-arabinose transferase-like glycosyltransferase
VNDKAARIALGLLLTLALTVRLSWALTRPADDAAIDQLPDQREYMEIARSLRSGEGLSFMDPRFGQRVYAYRTPGYPLLIAAVGAEVRLVQGVQCLFDTSTILATYLLARRWVTSARAVLAAAVVAFNPFLIYFCALLLTETLYTAMLAWGIVLLTDRRTLGWLIGGAVLALSVLVRPGAIGLPLVLGVLAAVLNRGGAGPYHRRWPLPVGTTMLLLTLAVLTPWAYRNHRVLGEWVWTSTNGGITSYDGFNPEASGASDQSFVSAMPQLRGMSETQRDEYLARKARDFAISKPLRAIQLSVLKVARTWSPMPLSEEFGRPAYVAVALAFSLPFYLLFLRGLVSNLMPASAKILLSAPAIYLTIAAVLSVGSLRYRIPAEVPMAVAAAAGMTSLRRQRDSFST